MIVMKKKHNKTKPTIEQPASAPRMTRREARIAARLSEEQRAARETFRQRMKNAPPRMRLKPVRTKAYYRFSKEYPAYVGADGYRENRPPVKKLSKTGKLLTALLCLAVFCLGFIGVRSAMLVSLLPGDTDYLASPTDALAAHGIAALRFSAEDLESYGAQDMKRALDRYGCNTALFEFKNETGYVAFSSYFSETAGDEENEAYDEYDEDGDYDYDEDYDEYESYEDYDEDDETDGEDLTSDSLWTTVEELEDMGIRTAAYISCFRDSVAADNHSGWAVRDFDEPDEPLVDDDGYMWLDPYQPEVTGYLTGLMQEALNGGFSYIVLDNVSFPYDLGLQTAYFSSADVADQGENSILLDFLAQALDVTGTQQLILMSDVNGIAAEATNRDNRYGGSLLTCGAEVFAVDARLSMQPVDEPDPLGVFAYKDDVPTAFILTACSTAAEAAKASEYVANPRVLVCVERGNDSAALQELLSHTGLNDYMIW